ncbi:MAG: cupredoxin domain-containing protein [Proteobacteria bacterium]|nr:cupredoxin domain-containing protein [Pseudomonadota bacterium]
MSHPQIRTPLVALLIALLPGAALAADLPEFTLTLQNHRYVPAELTIPANTKVKLIVVNKDPTAEEFESHELNREKVVAGGASINVYVGPLKPGRYPFFGDFNQATAQGVLIAR